MGVEFRHTLNDVEIDEPEGFSSIQFGPVRNALYHGIGFEATTSSLKFYGAAYDIINTANETTGLKSKIIYAAYSTCDEIETLVYSGRLNFGQLKKVCGSDCGVSLPIETGSCEVVLNSRFDQQVDVDKLTGVDNMTGLTDYAEMGNRITLKAKKVSTGLDIQVSEDGDTSSSFFALLTTSRIMFRPNYEVIRLNSVTTGYPDSTSYYQQDEDEFAFPISPQIFLDDFVDCFDGGFNYRIRMKGDYTLIKGAGGPDVILEDVKILILDWDGVTGNLFDNSTVVDSVVIWHGIQYVPSGTGVTLSFDGSLNGIYTLPDAHGLYAVLFFQTVTVDVSNLQQVHFEVNFDNDTLAFVTAEKACPDTDTDYYMIHETLSHVAEIITNSCLKVKSSYYGRLDSQPYSFDTNGCGGLRMLTSGLKIRNAENPTFFTSLKKLIDGLQAIDNIGYGVEGNDIRIEDVGYFYKNKEIARCPALNKASIDIDEGRHYAKITAGYSVWKVEKINGLDEFNSEREYKTSLETISNELKIQSSLVTGSYPIEVTRQQSFAATGAADTSYDNEVFLICLRRAEYPYSSFEVEQGNVTSPENMYSPETAYNWRLRPVANLMRWYKTIASSYRDFMNPENKIFFSSGTGNILAKGIMEDTVCRPENMITQENQDLFFTQVADYTPLWINEIIIFDYPLSINQYNVIKQDPYGYVSFQCGTGQWLKGFIKELKFKPVDGMANFTLIRKYGL